MRNIFPELGTRTAACYSLGHIRKTINLSAACLWSGG